MKKVKDSFCKSLLALAKLQKDHIFWTSLFVYLPGFWVPLLYTYAGVNLRLVQSEQNTFKLTVLGGVLLFIIVFAVIIGNVSSIYAEKTDDYVNSLLDQINDLRDDCNTISNINSSMNTVCDSKLITLTEKVAHYISNSQDIKPIIVSDPRRQLNALSKELSRCIAELLKFKERRYITDIFTSIAYRFPSEANNEWHWATSERGLSMAELLSEKDGKTSTFKYLIEHDGHIVFHNSKQTAFEKGRYLPDNEDEYDEEHKLKGSIACFQYEIKEDNIHLIDFVITITSYSQQFAQGKQDGDKYVQTIKDNLYKQIMPNFVVRTKTELCLLYLKYVREKNL